MSNNAPTVAQRIAALERRVTALETSAEPVGVAPATPPAAAPEQWWLLDRLSRHTGPDWERDGVSGALAFGGRLHTPGAGDIVWQLEHPAHAPLHADLDATASVLAALGHPVRLTLVRALLDGATTLAELKALPHMGTTGQLAHHLRELRAAGLVVSARRNHYAVARDRVVPVLIMLAAAAGPAALANQDEAPHLVAVPDRSTNEGKTS